MNKTNALVLLLALDLLFFLGCGPDAKHDNPLDPINGRGVWGTVYKYRGGGAVAGAVVTARPININTTSDAQGAYSLDLPGGQRYVLMVSHPHYRDTTDTIDVPADGKLEKNFLISGKPTITLAKVCTEVIQHAGVSVDHYLRLECLVSHPEGYSTLMDANMTGEVINKIFLPTSDSFDTFTKIYNWDLSWQMLFDTAHFDEGRIVSQVVTFSVNFSDGAASQQVMVPQFLQLAGNLKPSNYDTLTTSEYFTWDNAYGSGLFDMNVEVWDGTNSIWSVRVNNIDSVRCPDQINVGAYTWRVVTVDGTGNRSVTEATFTK